MASPPGLEFDYSNPRGEPALVSPDSVSWRIFKNPVSLFIGGVAAVILELAEPSVRSGVWDHSSFQKDAITRLRRTGAAAMMTVYGPQSAAERMISKVVKVHDRVKGTTPEGTEYHANDPKLLNWVQATANYGFIEAYNCYVSTLSKEERSKAYQEGAMASRLYGATNAPQSVDGWQSLLEATQTSLERSDIIFEFLSIMRHAEILPAPLSPIQRLLVRAAVDLVPDQLVSPLGLRDMGLSLPQRLLVVAMGKVVDKVPLRSAPPCQAPIRLGLDPTYLYRA